MMEELINTIINYVRCEYNLVNSAGISAAPQVVKNALVRDLQSANPNLQNHSILEAIDEMDARGWVTSRGDFIIFDKTIL